MGSLNYDVVVRLARLPEAGETLLSAESSLHCGGKGGNQAVACRRMGLAVNMIGRVGHDPIGVTLCQSLAAENIDIQGVLQIPGAVSGTALVMLTGDGENRIVVSPGANALLTPEDLAQHRMLIKEARILVCQLEIPYQTVLAAIGRARQDGLDVLFNPAPGRALPGELLGQIDYLVLNQTEAQALGALDAADASDLLKATRAANALRRRGPRCVLLTLGAGGVVISDASGERHQPARAVTAIDTTAAGDTFIGGVTAGLCEGKSIDEATALGIAAAALCVGRAGAQSSIPWRREIAGA